MVSPTLVFMPLSTVLNNLNSIAQMVPRVILNCNINNYFHVLYLYFHSVSLIQNLILKTFGIYSNEGLFEWGGLFKIDKIRYPKLFIKPQKGTTGILVFLVVFSSILLNLELKYTSHFYVSVVNILILQRLSDNLRYMGD